MINLTITDGRIDARELHGKLEVNDTLFRRWIKKYITNYDFEEGIDYIVVDTIVGSTNQVQKDYHVSIDMAKELCLLSKSKLGSAYRKYLINLDKVVSEEQREIAKSLIGKPFQNGTALFDELLQLAREQQKQITALESLMSTQDTYCVSDVCCRFKDCVPWDVTYNLIKDGYLVRRKSGIYPCFEMEESNTIVPHHYYLTDTDHVRYTNKGVVWLTEYLLDRGFKLK